MKTENLLTFNDALHEYRLNGVVVPSVTQILSVMGEYQGISEETLNKAAERGAAIHASIENHIKYGVNELESDEHQSYFDAFLKWEKDYKPQYIESEQRLYHKILRYAGTADLICRIDNNKEIIDFKTTATEHEKTWKVQLEAYAQALKSQGEELRGKRILQLKKDGSYKVFYYPIDDAVSWRIFGACHTIYSYKNS